MTMTSVAKDMNVPNKTANGLISKSMTIDAVLDLLKQIPTLEYCAGCGCKLDWSR